MTLLFSSRGLCHLLALPASSILSGSVDFSLSLALLTRARLSCSQPLQGLLLQHSSVLVIVHHPDPYVVCHHASEGSSSSDRHISSNSSSGSFRTSTSSARTQRILSTTLSHVCVRLRISVSKQCDRHPLSMRQLKRSDAGYLEPTRERCQTKHKIEGNSTRATLRKGARATRDERHATLHLAITNHSSDQGSLSSPCS